MTSRKTLLCLAAAMLAPLVVYSQTTGSILGIVTDPSGAAAVGAKVLATNTETNETRAAVANEAGSYSFPALPVGVYTVKCEMDGFRSWQREGLELSLNRNARVDIRLAVGPVN